MRSAIVSHCSVTEISSGAFADCDLKAVYYEATQSEWDQISIGSFGNETLTNATRYYYSESQPTEEGNFWHYVDGEIVVW